MLYYVYEQTIQQHINATNTMAHSLSVLVAMLRGLIMIIDTEYGQFDVDLSDDGTLDTVISVEHELYGQHDIRFSDTSHLRDADAGVITDEGFAELAKESVEAYIEQYLI